MTQKSISRIIITRPEPDCGVWTQAMQAQGLPAVALPLIGIAPVPFAWDTGAKFDAFVFVSRSAVAGFFQSQTQSQSQQLASLHAARCLVTGLGTRAALIQYGLAADRIDSPNADAAQFDSEALWQVIGKQDWSGKRVCVVGGSNHVGAPEGRSWLAGRLADAGAAIECLTTYQRRLPTLLDASRDIMQNPCGNDVWVFSSSQAIQHLKLLLPSADWSQSRAITTHDRIFITAKGVGFSDVQICRPVLSDVIAQLRLMIT